MKYDIMTFQEESLSIDVVAGEINSSRNKNITKKGVRLFENQKIYSSSVVGEISDSDILKKAESVKSVGIPYDYKRPAFSSLDTVDSESKKQPLHVIQEAIQETQEKLQQLSKNFVFNGKFNRAFYSVTIKNEENQVLHKSYGTNEWYYLFKKIGSPNLLDGYFGGSGKNLDINDVFLKNIPYVDAYNTEITFQNTKCPVLFIEGGELFGKLSESLRADKYCEGSAIYSGKLGTKLFTDKFSLYDINYAPEFSLYRRFDEEGVVRNLDRLPLIENGVFKNIICDLRNAKKYGLETTGNGTRSFDGSVGIGFNSLVMGQGTRSTQEILKSLDQCVVVFMGHGGDFTDSGEFSTPLQLSYLVKKGEIVGRLPQLTVKTTTQDMLNSRFIEVASDGFQKDSLRPSFFTEMDVYTN